MGETVRREVRLSVETGAQKQSRDSRKRARTVKVVLHKGVTQEAIKR